MKINKKILMGMGNTYGNWTLSSGKKISIDLRDFEKKKFNKKKLYVLFIIPLMIFMYVSLKKPKGPDPKTYTITEGNTIIKDPLLIEDQKGTDVTFQILPEDKNDIVKTRRGEGPGTPGASKKELDVKKENKNENISSISKKDQNLNKINIEKVESGRKIKESFSEELQHESKSDTSSITKKSVNQKIILSGITFNKVNERIYLSGKILLSHIWAEKISGAFISRYFTELQAELLEKYKIKGYVDLLDVEEFEKYLPLLESDLCVGQKDRQVQIVESSKGLIRMESAGDDILNLLKERLTIPLMLRIPTWQSEVKIKQKSSIK